MLLKDDKIDPHIARLCLRFAEHATLHSSYPLCVVDSHWTAYVETYFWAAYIGQPLPGDLELELLERASDMLMMLKVGDPRLRFIISDLCTYPLTQTKVLATLHALHLTNAELINLRARHYKDTNNGRA